MTQTNPIKTCFIILLVLAATASLAIRAVFFALFNQVKRPWVDKSLHDWTIKVLKLIKLDYKVFNPHKVTPKKNQPTMIVCNHTSHFDIPLSFAAFPHSSIRMLAKKELAKIPFFGRAMQVAEFPIVDRHNKQTAIQNLQRVKSLMQSGIVVWIAPEGTRSKTGELGTFKKGAFITAIEAGATIIPIGIKGANSILAAKSLKLNLNQRAEIHIGKPISATKYTLEEKDKLVNEVSESMLKLLTVG
ncbi:MAG: glycerol acyltransferase [Legionellales bacterium RIFCSPHIGHO2_12_FULL_37_14]|nr:MAG: glycerol acyltransferase [Legionellales bacterium RIFCSPHIGHO2_12_FULL_37_14]